MESFYERKKRDIVRTMYPYHRRIAIVDAIESGYSMEKKIDICAVTM